MELNKAQAAAAELTTGQLQVVAGAGTGKTRVIVQRISNLLDQGVKPQSILAVTFTEKAAAEMLERILQSRPDLHAEMPILTFNAFGERLLREFNTEIGLGRGFLLLSDSAQIVFLEQHLDELELDFYSPATQPKGQLVDVSKYFSKLKQNIVTPEAYDKFVKKMASADTSQKLEKTKHQELSRAYANYIRLCKEYNVIDYDDQIYRAIELLRVRPNIQTLLQDRYRAIMVDEFQDTNPMQSELIDLLSGRGNSLMVVGDDDQSIYGFRGATLANILDFKQRYPKSQEVTLIENYRSGQAILDAAYSLVQNNNPYRLEATLGIDKRLRAKKAGKKPTIKQFSRRDYELQWIVDDIIEHLAGGTPAGEIAVLVRNNTTAKLIGQALNLADIDYVIIGERYQLYRTEVVRMIVEALRCIIDTTNNTSLYHTLGSDLFGISGALLADLSGQARVNRQRLEEFLNEQSDETKVQEALTQIKHWREMAPTTAVDKLVYAILDETGYKNRIYSRAMSDTATSITAQQLTEFFRAMGEFVSIAQQPTALQYLESYPVLEAAGESSEDQTLQISNQRVNVLTIHKAKGLEWETVYIPDCVERVLPNTTPRGGIPLPEKLVAKHVSEADDQIAEERRLMYVAMTRAREDLIISFSRSHNGRTARRPSRFISETFKKDEFADSDGRLPPQTLELAIAESMVQKEVPLPASMREGENLRLSVSQIETYLHCPLNFYFKHILNIPEPASTQASYGQAIHGAIETINKALMSGDKPDLKAVELTLVEDIDNVPAESQLLKQRLQQQALDTIRRFYKSHVEDNPEVPQLVESSFRIRLADQNLVITGRLDAVFASEKGVEIRDYKTSPNVDTPTKAKNKATNSPQLTLYALVWQQQHDEIPHKLSLEFVNTDLTGSVGKTQRGIDTMTAKLEDMVKSITERQFKPGSKHDYCIHPDLD